MTTFDDVYRVMNELSLCESSFDELKVLVSTAIDSYDDRYNEGNETEEILNIIYKYLNYVSDEYHQKFQDAWLTTIEAGKELDYERAKLSRLQNPDNPQYTDEELQAMSIKELLS